MGTRVLVTDGQERSALAVVRSLGRAGYSVYVCSDRNRSIAGASRFATASACVASPLGSPSAFVAEAGELIRRWDIEVLLPMSEASLLALLPHRESLPVLIPFTKLDRFERICDKAEVMEAARRAGIAVPAQHVLGGPDVPTDILESLRYPLVLKPARSVSGRGATRAKTSVVHVADRDSFLREIDRIPTDAWPVLVQQRIIGPGIGIFVLIVNGEVRAAFSHQRIREKPVSGGVSVFRESIPVDADLLARSTALLEQFKWEGVAMVEYKVDQATQTPYIMEVNGRFWGSLQLAIDAGVDFPRLLLDPPANPVSSYRHVRSRWEWGEVDHLIARLRHSSTALSLPEGSSGRIRAVYDFLRAFRPGNGPEVFRSYDPAPFIRESLDWFRRL